MKRIIKASILSFVLCISALIFSGAASAQVYGYASTGPGFGVGLGFGRGYGYFGSGYGRGYGYGYFGRGYAPGYGYGYSGRGYGRGYGYGYYGRGKSYSCTSYSYDGCSGCYYPTVTYYRSYCVPYTGCSYDCCGCPKYYHYYQRYSCPVKSVKYYYPVRSYNNGCDSCYSNSGCGSNYGCGSSYSYGSGYGSGCCYNNNCCY